MAAAGDGFADIPTRQKRRPSPSRTGGQAFDVTVVDGPDRGKRLLIDGDRPGRVLIGLSPSSDLQLSDPMVSRRHAALDLSDDGLRLTDLGSTNGTFLGALAVFDVGLGGGETIRVGETRLAVARVQATKKMEPPAASGFGKLVGASPEMRRIYPLCERLAASRLPLVIEGETGTGKEVLAEAIHERGPRASGPFEVFDCTAVTPSLLEAALFGHEKGAFTGATSSRPGVFEEASGGTLLVDEIGDLDITLQAKLLRALERSEVRRVGGSRWIKVDVRVIAATRRDLDQAVQAGRFRDDLYFRVAVARVELPPLRKRHGDIPLLARHFWSELGGSGDPPAELLAQLEGYDWPGNVRELFNAVAKSIALGDLAELGPQAREAAAPPRGALAPQSDAVERVLGLDLPLPRARALLVDEFERRYVERVLEQHGGSVARAAQASGLARRYFRLLRARQVR